MMRAGPRATAAFAAAVGLCANAAPASEPVNPAYREIVELYARGERAAALARVARFSDAELVRKCPGRRADIAARYAGLLSWSEGERATSRRGTGTGSPPECDRLKHSRGGQG
jgi:hypothetical protein